MQLKFLKVWTINIVKNISKTDAIKTASKKAIQITEEATGDLTGNKTADKITSVSTHSQNNDANNEIKVSKEIYNNIITEYKKILNLLDNASNQPSKFKAKNMIEINDQSRETYNFNNDIKFKITMLKSSLCNVSDAYIIVKGWITITGEGAYAAARQAEARDKEVKYLKIVFHFLKPKK